MRRFDTFETRNAKEWDDVSTTSQTPSVSEVDAPITDDGSVLVDLSESPSLPQAPNPAPSPAQRLQALHQQNAARGPTAAVRAPSKPARAPAEYMAAQWNTQTRGTSVARGRGMGISYTNQVNAARHPQSNGAPHGGFQQPAGRGRGQPYSQNPALVARNLNQARVVSTPPTHPASYQQNVKLNNYSIGYRSNSGDASDSTRRPSQVDANYRPDRRGPQNQPTGRMNVYGTPKKGVWAEPEALKTTRRAADHDIKTSARKEREKYLGKPIDEDRTLAYGFYLWPKDDGPANEVLGIDLAPLRHVRMNEKVYINIVEGTGKSDLLKINSESTHSEEHIAVSIRAIRSVIAHAKARAVLATPKYFVVPLTASAMRSIIAPKTVVKETVVEGDVQKTKNVLCIGTQMLGQPLSKPERKKWEESAERRNSAYVEDFKKRLSSSLMELAPLKIEMRMRIHFGHIIFQRFPPEYSASKYSVDDFTELLGHHMAKLEIDKAIPSAVAISMARKIINMPNRFRPASGRILSLQAIPAKHTEIFFVKTRRGDDFRVEADIDARYEEESASSEEFQVGSYNVFRNDCRDKRIELSTVDPEREIDFTLQVITDSLVEIPQPSNKEFEALINGSLSKQHREDSLRLRYPWVLPRRSSELQITKLVMRSVIQYVLQSTGFVVEIAFYRTWFGPDTRDEPEIVAGISMYHPQWDMEMESTENSTDSRKWKRGLSNFFEGGFDEFLNELRGIQELLSTTAQEVEQEAALQQAAMELQDAMTESAGPERDAKVAAGRIVVDAGLTQDAAFRYATTLEEQKQARAKTVEKAVTKAVLTRSLLDD